MLPAARDVQALRAVERRVSSAACRGDLGLTSGGGHDPSNLMNDSATNQAPASSNMWNVERRVDEILLKLLDGIERDVNDGKLPSQHLETYAALLRAEADRRPG